MDKRASSVAFEAAVQNIALELLVRAEKWGGVLRNGQSHQDGGSRFVAFFLTQVVSDLRARRWSWSGGRRRVENLLDDSFVRVYASGKAFFFLDEAEAEKLRAEVRKEALEERADLAKRRAAYAAEQAERVAGTYRVKTCRVVVRYARHRVLTRDVAVEKVLDEMARLIRLGKAVSVWAGSGATSYGPSKDSWVLSAASVAS